MTNEDEEIDERVPLTYDQAVAMLPAGERIHTFRGGGGVAVGADWPREKLLEAIKEWGVELSGPSAIGMGHGMVLIDTIGVLFIETVQYCVVHGHIWASDPRYRKARCAVCGSEG